MPLIKLKTDRARCVLRSRTRAEYHSSRLLTSHLCWSGIVPSIPTRNLMVNFAIIRSTAIFSNAAGPKRLGNLRPNSYAKLNAVKLKVLLSFYHRRIFYRKSCQKNELIEKLCFISSATTFQLISARGSRLNNYAKFSIAREANFNER